MSITQSYVDYGAGSDATGDGTIGTPWKTLQKAFDTLTRNTTDGNQVNLKAGTAHVNVAALDLATFIGGGALSVVAPLIISGYTSAAGDGGVGEIDAGGATFFAETTYDYIVLRDLNLHNFGNNNGIVVDFVLSMFRCSVHAGASTPSGKLFVTVAAGVSRIEGCYFYDVGATGTCVNIAGGNIIGCFANLGTNTNAQGFLIGNNGGNVENCIVYANVTTARGIKANGTGTPSFRNNICYNKAAATTNGIYTGSTGSQHSGSISNNIIVGWSGAGGCGISGAGNVYLLGYNAFYNCTTNNSIADQTFIDLTANDVALAADPFTDAANGDFSLTAAAKTALAAKGFPISYLGAHANTVSNLNIGPIQMAAGSGGGSAVYRAVMRTLGG